METLRRYFRDIAEEKSADRWLPILGGVIFFAGLAVSVLELLVLQQGKYQLTVVSAAGKIMLPSGFALRTIARRALSGFFSPVIKIRPGQKLITTGPYKLIRHPIYLSELFSYFSFPMILGSFYGFVVMLIIVPILLYRISFEEKTLISRFGQEYVEYKKKIKKLIPYVY